MLKTITYCFIAFWMIFCLFAASYVSILICKERKARGDNDKAEICNK